MVKLKPGVSFAGLQPEGEEIRQAIDEVASGLGIDLTITCTTRDHPQSDPHPHGFAIDVRTLDLTPSQIVQVYRLLWKRLGTDRYTVRFEVKARDFAVLPQELKDIASINDAASTQHLHIQCKKGLWQQLVAERTAAITAPTEV